jgi:hypothetical protein
VEGSYYKKYLEENEMIKGATKTTDRHTDSTEV